VHLAALVVNVGPLQSQQFALAHSCARQTSTASASSGSRSPARARTRRTSSDFGDVGFDLVDRGRSASFDGLLSISPRLQENSSDRERTVAHRRTQSLVEPFVRIAPNISSISFQVSRCN
jgi:hypothetical protein